MRLSAQISSLIDVRDLLEYSETLRKIPELTEDYARKIFFSPKIRQFIINANQDLLRQGLRPDLTYISKEPQGNQQSKFYERLTKYNRANLKSGYDEKDFYQTQFVDLYKTGFFYNSLKVRAGSNELIEGSSDPKFAELEAVWGLILGISSEDLDKLSQEIVPQIIKFVNDRLTVPKA